MTPPFLPHCRPLLLGSLPGIDPTNAVDTVFRYTPDFPCWPQLPQLDKESILQQFTTGLPGYDNLIPPGTFGAPVKAEVELFCAEYEAVITNRCSHDTSRFILDHEHCPGFFRFLHHLENHRIQTEALKGQIVGPLTLLTCIKDMDGPPLFSHKQLHQCVTRLLALKAKWQVRQLSPYCKKVMIFIDEPMLFALGKPMMPEISSRDFLGMYAEIFQQIRSAGGLCGIHVCGSTDWAMVLATGVDIISFDAFHYHRELLSLREEIWHFINHGGILAFGIIPTDTQSLMQESVSSLFAKLTAHLNSLSTDQAEQQKLMAQSFITPACGTGRLTEQQSTAVLQMAAELSSYIRNKNNDTVYH